MGTMGKANTLAAGYYMMNACNTSNKICCVHEKRSCTQKPSLFFIQLCACISLREEGMSSSESVEILMMENVFTRLITVGRHSRLLVAIRSETENGLRGLRLQVQGWFYLSCADDKKSVPEIHNFSYLTIMWMAFKTKQFNTTFRSSETLTISRPKGFASMGRKG